jgi:hypothetical protein
VTPLLLLVVDIVVLGERSSCGSTAYVGVDRSFPTLACTIHPFLVSFDRPSYFGVAASFNGALPPLAHRFLNGLICSLTRPAHVHATFHVSVSWVFKASGPQAAAYAHTPASTAAVQGENGGITRCRKREATSTAALGYIVRSPLCLNATLPLSFHLAH